MTDHSQPAPDNAPIWRNGVANTVAVIDIARRKFSETVRLTRRQRAAVEAFDGFLDKVLQDWFDATREASPQTYEEAEAVWLRFLRPPAPEQKP